MPQQLATKLFKTGSAVLVLLLTFQSVNGLSQSVKDFRYTEVVCFTTTSFVPVKQDYFSSLIADDIPTSKLNRLYNFGLFSHYHGRLYMSVELGFTYGTSNSEKNGLKSILRRQYGTARIGYNFLVSEYVLASIYTGVGALRIKHKTDTPEGFGTWPDYSSNPLHRVRLTQFYAPVGLQVSIPLFDKLAVLQAYGDYLIPLGSEPVINTKNLALNPAPDRLFTGYAVGIGVGYNFGAAWL